MLETELLLHGLGITTNYKGYEILVAAVDIVLRDENALSDVMETIYNGVAVKLNISAASVERNIRTAISHAWDIAPNRFGKVIGWPNPYPPTSSELIRLLTEKVKESM